MPQTWGMIGGLLIEGCHVNKEKITFGEIKNQALHQTRPEPPVHAQRPIARRFHRFTRFVPLGHCYVSTPSTVYFRPTQQHSSYILLLAVTGVGRSVRRVRGKLPLRKGVLHGLRLLRTPSGYRL